MDFAALADLAESKVLAGEMGSEQWKQLGQHASQRCASAVAADQAVDWSKCLEIPIYFAGDLTAETRAKIVSEITGKLGKDEATISALSGMTAVKAAQALSSLGQTSGIDLCVTWVTSSDKYKTLSWDVIFRFATVLDASGPSAAAARVRLGEAIVDKSSDPQQARTAPLGMWMSLISAFDEDLSAEEKLQLAVNLREAFIRDNQALASLGRESVWMLMDVAEMLGSTGDAGIGARASLAQNLVDYLASAESGSVISLPQWVELVRELNSDLADEQRSAWAEKLQQVYGSTASALSALRAADARALVEAVASLDSAKGVALANSWLDNTGSLEDVDAALSLLGISGRDMSDLLSQREPSWLDKYQRKVLTHRDCHAISEAWNNAGNRVKSEEWAMRGYQLAIGTDEARRTADQARLNDVISLLADAGLDRRGNGYTAYATVLARLAREKKISGDWEMMQRLARPLRDSQSRQIVIEELGKAGGSPGRVGAILAWSYQYDKELNRWKQLLDQKIADANIQGDVKANWLLARAHAESIPRLPILMIRGQQWLDQGLISATSDALRLEILRDIVCGYAAVENYDAAFGVLDSTQGQFTDAVSRVVLEDIRKEANGIRDRIVAAKRAYDARHERGVRDAYKAELRKRFKAAQDKNEQDRAARLGSLIDSVEAAESK